MITSIYSELSPLGRAITLAAGVLILCLASFLVYRFFKPAPDLRLQLQGHGVESLVAKSPVILAGETIGVVNKKIIVGGQATALITIKSKFADQIVDGCKFRVTNDGFVTTGQIYLRVDAPGDFNTRERLAQNMLIQTEHSILPVEIPRRLPIVVLALALMALLIILIFAIAKRLSKLIVLAIIAAIIGLIAWWFLRERVVTPERPPEQNLSHFIQHQCPHQRWAS
jgi:hypothetical protein